MSLGRVFVAVLGVCISALAIHSLFVAVQSVLSDGTILVSNPIPRAARKGLPPKYPVPWQEAWSYLVSCVFLFACGVSFLVSGLWAKIGLFLLAFLLGYVAFVLRAATLTLGSWSGLATFVGVWVGGVVLLLVGLRVSEKLERWRMSRKLER
jgi:hypothetical protein